MSNVPAVFGALIADGLSAIGVPGASTAGEAVKGYIKRRSDVALGILFDEFQRGEIDATALAAEDDRVAVLYRYLRASWEGSARINLCLLAKAIVGRLRTNSLVADEFLPHADALAALSRDEIILLATLLRCFSVAERSNFNKWEDCELELSKLHGWDKARTMATAGRALRSGYVVLAASGIGDMVTVVDFRVEPSSLLLDLCRTVDFDDALRREAGGGQPL